MFEQIQLELDPHHMVIIINGEEIKDLLIEIQATNQQL